MIRSFLYTAVILLHTMANIECSDTDSPYVNVPPPRFVATPTNFTVRPGDSITLPCSIQHLGTKRVAWRRADTEEFLTIGENTWIDSDNFRVEHEEKVDMDITVWNLRIDHVTDDMAGEYECQATASAGHARSVFLQVVGTPITKPDLKLYGNKYVEQGQMINLTCNATGGLQTPEDIDWFLEGDLIEPHKYKDIIITKYRSIADRTLVSQLIVDHSDMRHAGTYICRSSDNRIDNLTVSVLVAETTNVKRGTGDIQASKSVGNRTKNSLSLLLLTLLLSLVTCSS